MQNKGFTLIELMIIIAIIGILSSVVLSGYQDYKAAKTEQKIEQSLEPIRPMEQSTSGTRFH